MTDFNDSLRRGLDAARQAQANRDEIKAVFSELNRALNAMSDGKIEVAIVPVTTTMSALNRLAKIYLDKDQEERVIAVRRIGETNTLAKLLAHWKQGSAGFPCSIIWNERHASCEDVESLRAELATLVSSPAVGEAILALMQAPPSEISAEKQGSRP